MKSIFAIDNLIFSLSAFKEPTDLYIVGDSLSDTGNAYKVTCGKRPNTTLYTNHRYSNGPVWNDYLAEKYPNLKVKNYSVGGATTDNNDELSNSTPKKCKSNKSSKKLVVIWACGNDFIANATIASKEIIPCLLKITTSLVQTPFGNILLPTKKEGLDKAIVQLNQGLSKAINVEQAKDPSQKLTLVDINQIISKLISVPSSISHNWEPFGYCVDRKNPLTTNICENPNDFFFWDQQHPNTESHERVSNELETVFKQLGYI
ncbi:carbohydrate esterase family 16 protein [Conidiobolus coronatus NRRL 28638]|uniref:Carbohydrate esterase family 16 protein n=1 Tax=Conidiobolus coronatus (strain ATCC 28846 / CBS 209.66 / NRRL 28638) TaxID=796925 RepID=A0A137NR65_CONC2|nr:carbohydrate esterase family 16 protein [Conidiobolus coronatus NRRL 28638]|eukprot:KXN65180.1 carbohydrate esterase family 16 protein [Conidiobolus coronatus NRRL 28638]